MKLKLGGNTLTTHCNRSITTFQRSNSRNKEGHQHQWFVH